MKKFLILKLQKLFGKNIITCTDKNMVPIIANRNTAKIAIKLVNVSIEPSNNHRN